MKVAVVGQLNPGILPCAKAEGSHRQRPAACRLRRLRPIIQIQGNGRVFGSDPFQDMAETRGWRTPCVNQAESGVMGRSQRYWFRSVHINAEGFGVMERGFNGKRRHAINKAPCMRGLKAWISRLDLQQDRLHSLLETRFDGFISETFSSPPPAPSGQGQEAASWPVRGRLCKVY